MEDFISGDLGGLLSFSKRRQVFSIGVVGNSFSGGALAYYLELACVSYNLSRNKLKEKLQTEQLRDLTFGMGPGWDSFVIENYKNIITKFLKTFSKLKSVFQAKKEFITTCISHLQD